MNLEQEQMTLDIARRLLADPRTNSNRRAWADDVVLAIEYGDIAAARRIGMWELSAVSQQHASAGECPMCHEPHTLSQCPRWRTRNERANSFTPLAASPLEVGNLIALGKVVAA